ncbi:MAG: DUF3764 family protein [Alphaproteobacteria bacterium]
MFVMLTQDLTKGFQSWKDMFLENQAEFNALGGKLVFAGPEKENDNKMMVIIEFETPDAMKAFATNEDLRAKRAASGAVLESNVITHLGDASFVGS